MLEENTLEPNSNRFDPSNSHLLCCSGPGLHTQPLPASLFWASVNMLFFISFISEHNKYLQSGGIWKKEKDNNPE